MILTFITTSYDLNKNEGVNPVEERKCRGMIDSLLYLIAYCLDIIFVVCVCAYFQTSPKESHLFVVKRIMRYLIGIHDMG